MLAVMAQARHVRAVHSVICELLMIAMPDIVKGNSYIRNTTEFCERIDHAIREATTPDSKEDDYIRAIVSAACSEMTDLCRLLRSACSLAGLEKVAAEYLDANRFREMLLRKDSEKLERIVSIVQAREGRPIKILMDVAAALDGRDGNYDGMDVAAKRKAANDMRKLIGKVDQLRSTIDEHRDEIIAHVDEVGAKVDRIRSRSKRGRRARYGEAARAACLAYWDEARRNAEVKHATNTRITRKSVFEYYRRELAARGIDTLNKFCAVLHAEQSRECEARRRKLDEQREAERKAKRSAKPRKSRLVV